MVELTDLDIFNNYCGICYEVIEKKKIFDHIEYAEDAYEEYLDNRENEKHD